MLIVYLRDQENDGGILVTREASCIQRVVLQLLHGVLNSYHTQGLLVDSLSHAHPDESTMPEAEE